ncbi:PREDICTED: serpin B9-like isoform X2 [Chinchilla lanigera]|uniref:serpin B9-like isoform X2 n=1 Tax=Chinchilla lanigera TaxID=34839 RepID=UPI0006985384|nr:PREDICTED: serpin B9-like isoform X2 [Chinchilla lanigera]
MWGQELIPTGDAGSGERRLLCLGTCGRKDGMGRGTECRDWDWTRTWTDRSHQGGAAAGKTGQAKRPEQPREQDRLHSQLPSCRRRRAAPRLSAPALNAEPRKLYTLLPADSTGTGHPGLSMRLQLRQCFLRETLLNLSRRIMNRLSEANGIFAIRLLKLLGQEDPARNVFYSPLSVSSALAMVLLGAKGSTAAQIVQALGLNTEDDIHQGFQSLLTQVHRPGAPFALSIANGLFGEESCQFLSKEQKPVQMMFQKATFPLAHVSEVQAQVLELPYVGPELSMVLVLPDEGVDLSSVGKTLTFGKFQSWTRPEHMKKTKVEVFLPRFKLQEDYDMGSVLQGLGVVDAFHPGKADLSGMLADSNLCVSKFVHKSVVEVNEEGTEAAAVAGMIVVPGCCADSVPRFCADHPFLFFIRHNSTNCLLFCGRFSSP